MKRLTSGATILVAALALGPLHVAAQQGRFGGGAGFWQRPGAGMAGPRRARWMMRQGGRGAVGVELLMRMRERLKLTDGQFKRLDAIRADAVQRQIGRQASMIELRSRVLAGEATRGALVDSMTAWRKAARAAREETRTRVESILSSAQKDTLKTMMRRRWALMLRRERAFGGMRGRMWGGGRGLMWPGGMPRYRSGPGAMGGAMPGAPTVPPAASGVPPSLPDSGSAGGSGSPGGAS